MKKEILNSVLIGLLLSFTVLFLFGFLTIFNKNYIKRYLDKYNYYEIKYNNIKKEIEYLDNTYEYELSIDDVKEDINYYVSNNFENIQIHRFDNKDMNDIYSSNVKIDNYFIEHSNYNTIKILSIIIMITLIIITFELYLNLKCEVYNFLFMSGIFGLIINYIMYKAFYFNLDIVDYLYNKYMLFYLIANIVQLLLSIYFYISINKITVKRK
jgi:hypothetical protein